MISGKAISAVLFPAASFLLQETFAEKEGPACSIDTVVWHCICFALELNELSLELWLICAMMKCKHSGHAVAEMIISETSKFGADVDIQIQ